MKAFDKGFTLIEAMVAMMIVSVGLLAMASMLITGIKTNHASENRMDAAALAQSVMSRINVNARADNYSAGTATIDAENFLGGKFDANGRGGGYKPTVTFSATTASGAFTSIEVKLEWDNHGNMKDVTLLSGVYTE